MPEQIDTVIVGTTNEDKFREIISILDIEWLTVRPLNEYNVPEVEETGSTYSENAFIKARAIFSLIRMPLLTDDSGLEVEALENRPGIKSARYAGGTGWSEENTKKLLSELSGVSPEQRKARFVCCACLYFSEDDFHFFEGDCSGFITDAPRGEKGFGYDPVFFMPELGMTMAELDLEIKNKISHRAKAMMKVKTFLESLKGLQ
jgi:XTP/dITP diphosphohydrolase